MQPVPGRVERIADCLGDTDNERLCRAFDGVVVPDVGFSAGGNDQVVGWRARLGDGLKTAAQGGSQQVVIRVHRRQAQHLTVIDRFLLSKPPLCVH